MFELILANSHIKDENEQVSQYQNSHYVIENLEDFDVNLEYCNCPSYRFYYKYLRGKMDYIGKWK